MVDFLRETYQYNETCQGHSLQGDPLFHGAEDFKDANKGRTDVLMRFDPY